MEHIETEVKFNVSNVHSMRNRIIGLGAEVKDRVFETNVRFEDAHETLFRNQSLLRLRRDTKTILTFKFQPPVRDDQFKTFSELEVEISNFETMTRILEHIGFRQAQIYEKWRETFILDHTTVCLDTMPYGDFLEIEGKKEHIRKVVSRIELKWRERIIMNYLAIFDILRHELKLPFTDVTFKNFDKVKFNFADYSHLIVAE